VPVFAVICPARILSAQLPDVQASITGTAFDSNGSFVRDAEITAKNQTTGAVSNDHADNVGQFAITGIPSGRYTIIVVAKGFATMAEKDVVASVTPAGISVELTIGSLEESVELEGIAVNSIASRHALSQGSLGAGEPVSNISGEFIKEFTPSTTDYSDHQYCAGHGQLQLQRYWTRSGNRILSRIRRSMSAPLLRRRWTNST
jgi:hypothetical protein